VPSDIVAIYPRFRGMRFTLVEDDIVIVSPDTDRIVAVLPRFEGEGSSYASRAPRETTGAEVRETTGVATRERRLDLTPRAREIIHTTVVREQACHLEQRLDFILLMPVPRTVEVCEFPSQLVEEVPEIRPYRYVVRGGEVAIVDPEDDQRVVEVLE
jgi:hypothetical protein